MEHLHSFSLETLESQYLLQEKDLLHTLKEATHILNQLKLSQINETTANIDNATIKSKDGVTIKFYIKDLKANPTLDIDKFLWDSSKYPNVDEIDNR